MSDCCCGGCSQTPRDDSIEFGDLQPIQAWCCGCMPKQVCVTISNAQGDFYGIVDILQPCVPPDDTKTVWRGEVGVESTLVDVDFSWEVEDETCYLVFKSGALGETGTNRVEMDQPKRAILCPRCQGCPQDKLVPATVDFALAGGTTVKIRPASNTSLSHLERCCDCPDPCNPPEEERGCPKCGNCSCICSEACITVLIDGELDQQNVGPFCNNQYQASGMTITLVEVDGCCQLELTEATGYTWDMQPDNVPIDDITNPCPRPVGMWAFYDAIKDQTITVVFSCAGCGGCDTVLNTCGCPAPLVLEAYIESGSQCCGTLSIPLVYSGPTTLWAGEVDDLWCGGNIRVEMGCDGDNWTVTVTASNCVDEEGNLTASATHILENCSPFLVRFQVELFDENEVGPWCCIGRPGGTTLDITISLAA